MASRDKGWAGVAATAFADEPAAPGKVAAWTKSALIHFDFEWRATSYPARVETTARATNGAANRQRRAPIRPVPLGLAGRGDSA
jgi:hypothetical protein